ncbi:hypothetical protein M378DRAFT_157328, partial [Amanita muscaria Koide BX008]
MSLVSRHAIQYILDPETAERIVRITLNTILPCDEVSRLPTYVDAFCHNMRLTMTGVSRCRGLDGQCTVPLRFRRLRLLRADLGWKTERQFCSETYLLGAVAGYLEGPGHL